MVSIKHLGTKQDAGTTEIRLVNTAFFDVDG